VLIDLLVDWFFDRNRGQDTDPIKTLPEVGYETQIEKEKQEGVPTRARRWWPRTLK
jgi:hypothetical protein